MSTTPTTRQLLDSFWAFADNLRPRNKWGVIASASDADSVLASYIYYVRYHDALLMTINSSNWRHMGNLSDGRVFSFLIANTEVFDEEPLKYERLFLQGRIAAFPRSSSEFEKLHRVYAQSNSIDPKLMDHVCVLRPMMIAGGIKTAPEYFPQDTALELIDTLFDAEFQYCG